MPVTLAVSPLSSTGIVEPAMGKKPATETIRIHSDLARKARIIAAAKGISVPDYIAEVLRPIIETELAEALKEFGIDGEGDKPKKK